MYAYRNAAVVIATSVAYYALYELNTYVFSILHYSHSAAWIFLPSGLRLIYVLVFGGWGALGIAIGSVAIALEGKVLDDTISLIGYVVLASLGPLLARWFCQMKYRLDDNLENLSGITLIKMCAIFAVISPLLHFAWLYFRGYTNNLLGNVLVMAVGDFTGAVVLLYLVKLLLSRMPRGELSK